MYQRSRTSWAKHLDFMLLDLVCLHIAFVFAYIIRFPGQGSPYTVQMYLAISAVMTMSQVIASLMLNSLSHVLRREFFLEIISLLLLTLLTLAITALYLFAVHSGEAYSRLVLFYTALFFLIIGFCVRTLWKRIVRWRIATGRYHAKNNRAILVLAKNYDGAVSICESIKEDNLAHFNIKGIVLVDKEGESEVDGIPVVSSLEDAPDYICREWIDEILIDVPNTNEIQSFLKVCAEMGVTVHSVIHLQNVNRNKQFIESIGKYTVFTTAFNYVSAYQTALKRMLDILGGIVGSIIAVLIGIVVGPIIFINSPGPIIFKQKRIGRNGKPFWVLKFRSMYLDAEDRKKSLMTENRVSDGMMFKMDFDPRIIGNKVLPDGTKKTGIGEFIRKTSLDEFPQFFNVLRGDMSLVGTRPPTVDEWEKYKYHHRARLAIKPGITGLWQVSGRSEITDFEEVVRLDTEYILTFRLLNDIKILLKTVIVLLQRKGAM